MKKVWILLIILLCPLVIKAENINNYYLKLAINKLNEKQQTNKEIIYIDTKNIFENNKSLLSNPKSIYPNRTGYKEISNEIIAKITKKLEKV